MIAWRPSSATLLLREPGVVAGLGIARQVFLALDPDLRWEAVAHDGDHATTGPVARLEAHARAVLTGERLALNLLGRLSGIATLTRRYVDAVAGTDATILDTRKTTPTLRVLEKYAVRVGGGTNHRMTLDSQPLTERFVAAQDCLVIVTDHSAYDYAWLTEHARLIVDTRNATAKCPPGKGRVWKA